eukprot:scaffold1248_cov393-Prasinococcus_capsulatus_cf.AAC.14
MVRRCPSLPRAQPPPAAERHRPDHDEHHDHDHHHDPALAGRERRWAARRWRWRTTNDDAGRSCARGAQERPWTRLLTSEDGPLAAERVGASAAAASVGLAENDGASAESAGPVAGRGGRRPREAGPPRPARGGLLAGSASASCAADKGHQRTSSVENTALAHVPRTFNAPGTDAVLRADASTEPQPVD